MSFPNRFTEERELAEQPAVTNAWVRMPNGKVVPSKPPMRNEADQRDLLTKLMGDQQDIVNEQRQGIADLAATPSRVDLTPLMALADAWGSGKSNLAGGYKAPMSPEEKEVTLAKLRDLASKDQQQVTKDQLQLLMGDNKNENAWMRALAGMNAGIRGEIGRLNLEYRKENDLKKVLEKKETDLSELYTNLRNLNENLESGEYQKIGAILPQFARGISGEKGVLTDEDIKRLIPDNIRATVADIRSYFAKTPSAKMKPEYTKLLREMVDQAQVNAVERYGRSLGNFRKMTAAQKSMAELMMPGSSGDMMIGTMEKDIEGRKEELRAKGIWVDKPDDVDEKDWEKLSYIKRRQFVEQYNAAKAQQAPKEEAPKEEVKK